MNHLVSFAANSESVTPLQKGKACVNCRRRKIQTYMWTMLKIFDYLRTNFDPTNSDRGIGEPAPPSVLHLTYKAYQSSGVFPNISEVPTSAMGLGPLLSHFYLQQTSGDPLKHAAATSMPTELPYIVLQALVHNFLHNASCFGFFLNTQAFHDAVTSTDGRQLPPVLLNVMYLWGVHLSKDARITVYEPAFLAHALRSTAGICLLAYYFIRNARFLEGKYHTSAAVSIAVSAGLHRIRARQEDGPIETPSFSNALPPAKCAAEEGERISAFWSVLNLNNCWAGTDGSPSNVSYGEPGLKIDTPWPLDTSDYVERPHLLPLKSSETVTKFLSDVPDDATSDAALYAKASILFEEATRIGTRYRANGSPSNDAEFRFLDQKIDHLTATLPPIQSKHLLVVHTVCHGATIQLHSLLEKERTVSRAKRLAAARAIVDILVKIDVPKVGLIDPILAPLWTSACLVFISSIARQRNGGNQAKVLTESLNILIAAMEVFAPHCRLMTAQLAAVRQAFSGARND
ncbi:hypothetical protein B0H13DRAFT_2416594 [Mycena leptocephala]|nr:hypothetical protein B0H13DRAFT_2416594 [Mycena leptocephala]